MSKSKRKKVANETDKKILEYLQLQPNPVSFYKLYKDLGFSSGKTQTALNRMKKKGILFLKKRIKRFENLVWYKNFDLESNIIDLEEENEIIVPVRLNRIIGIVMQEILELTFNYDNLSDLFKTAILYFFREKLPYDLRSEAIYQAIQKGKITESLGKQILRE